MKAWAGALLALASLGAVAAAAQDNAPTVTVEFSNPSLAVAHWVLVLHPDGSGHFRAERGATPPTGEIQVGGVNRAVQLSPGFASWIFAVARQKHGFNLSCESHLKVAFQGWKTLSYTGPDGKGACTFNFSTDKEIAALGEQMLAVATTLEEGARLEMLLQHDRLGLDRETEFLLQSARDGQARELGAIRGILERLADDESVLERVRKRARQMLTMP